MSTETSEKLNQGKSPSILFSSLTMIEMLAENSQYIREICRSGHRMNMRGRQR